MRERERGNSVNVPKRESSEGQNIADNSQLMTVPSRTFKTFCRTSHEIRNFFYFVEYVKYSLEFFKIY